MPTISTLSGQTVFEYTPDGIGGFFIEYTNRPHISIEFIQKIQSERHGGRILNINYWQDYLSRIKGKYM